VIGLRDAAVDFTATLADERAAVQRAGELAAAVAAGAAMLGEPLPDVAPEVSTSLLVDPGHASGRPLALMRAFSEARIGDAEAVAVCLAEAFGWLPPDPAELAAEQERLRRPRWRTRSTGPPRSAWTATATRWRPRTPTGRASSRRYAPGHWASRRRGEVSCRG
jgi:hypothetical protein